MGPCLSLVIPAYNEARRLPAFLATVRQYLDARYAAGYEVLVVDDGSQDDSPEVLARWAADWPALSVIRLQANQGKGAAVRTGVLAAWGELVLFADADGAAPIDQEAKLAAAMAAGADLAVGSRLVPRSDVARRRTRLRGLVGRWFAAVARRWLKPPTRDTQCGFKMFRREVAQQLFSLSRESGYLFDLEILVLADRFGYRIAEVPIDWADVPGGHLSLARDFATILLDLWRLRRRLRHCAATPTKKSTTEARRTRSRE